MAWVKKAFVDAKSTNTTSVDTTATPVDTSGADLIVVAVSCYDPGPFQVSNYLTDSAGNTWVLASATGSLANQTHVVFYYCFNPSTSASHTFTWNIGRAVYPSMRMLAFSGSSASVDGATSVGASGSATSIQAAGTVGGTAGDLFISAYANDPTITGLSVNSGLTMETYDAGSANAEGGTIGWLASNSALNPTWSWTSAHVCECFSIAFKGSSGSAFSLDCSPGSYGLTGVGDANNVASNVTGAAGAYAITGVDFTPLAAYNLNGAPGQYAVSGLNITTPAQAYLLNAGAGSFAIVGADTGPTSWVRSLDSGVYSLVGRPAYLRGPLDPPFQRTSHGPVHHGRQRGRT